MSGGEYTIRSMSREELDIAVDWAAVEGWNPGLGDAECFYTTDPTGFFMGFLDDEPIASISAVKYGDSFGFVGFYIVKPEHRGKGYGLRLWNEALKSLEGRTVGLDGVVAQQANYRKSGFVLAYNNARYETAGRKEGPAGAGCLRGEIAPLETFGLGEVVAYDAALFPADRTRFVEAWISQPEAVALGFGRQGRLTGYGVARRCRRGYKIGPLLADSAEIAEALFVALHEEVPVGEPLCLDIPEVNEKAVELVGRYGMRKVFETARMYKGTPPQTPIDRIYGVTTFELG